jgi:hypothetical protein
VNRLYTIAIVGIAIVSAGTAVLLYYSFMPAWLFVERIESTEHDVISLSDSALEASPKLKEALQTADERYNPRLPGTNSFKLSNSEGSRILEIIREYGDSADSGERFRIENNEKYYLVSVLFHYEPPALA